MRDASTPPEGPGHDVSEARAGAVHASTALGWVDLLGDLTSGHVLVIGPPPPNPFAGAGDTDPWDASADDAVEALAAVAARVDQVDTVAAAVAARQRDPAVGRDAVVVRELALPRREWRRLATVAPDARLIVLADNSVSPQALVDRVRGGGGGRLRLSAWTLHRRLTEAGFEVERSFGLMRSSRAPATAVDLDAPTAARAVLRAAGVPVGTRRRLVLRAIGPAVGVAGPLVLPALLIVARPRHRHDPRIGHDTVPGTVDDWGAPADRVTGRIGYRDSDERIVVRGEPPWCMEKVYLSEAAADAEAAALSALQDSPFVPAMLGRPAPRRVRQAWMAGHPVTPAAMSSRDVLRLAGEACDALGVLQARTAAPDGTVLVHRDFWLGNMLVDDDRIVGVVDWTGATRGSASVDVAHLVDSLVASGHVDQGQAPSHAARLQVRVDRSRARSSDAGVAHRGAGTPEARGSAWSVAEVTTGAALDELAEDWQRLADAAGAFSSMHPWWARPWYDHVGTGSAVVVVARCGPEVRAVLPLQRRGLGPLTVDRFAGHGLGAIGEVLAEPGDRAAIDAVWAHLARRPAHVLDLRNLREGPSLDAWYERFGPDRIGPEPGRPDTGTDRCPWLRVPTDLDAHLATRRKSFRRTMAKARRRLSSAGLTHTVDIVTDRAGLAAALPDVLAVYDAAEAANPRAHLLRGQWADFTGTVLSAAADRGRLRLYLGRVDGRPVSFDIGFVGASSLELTIGRVDPWSRPYSTGHLSTAAIATDPVVMALGRIDFGLGDDEYKHSWTDDGDRTVDVVGAAGRRRQALARRGLDALAARH